MPIRAVGIAMMMFIKAMDARSVEPSYPVGLIPVSVDLSLLLYVYVLAPREPASLPMDKG